MEKALGSIFLVSGVASLALAAFSFSLPKTPPQAGSASGAAAPLKALKLLAVPAFAVLFVVTLMDAMVHQAYFQFTGTFLAKAGLAERWIPAAMSIGQIAEIAHDGLPRLLPEAPGLAEDHDLRHPRPRRPLLHLRGGRSAVAHDRDQHPARLLLRVLLRVGLHLRGRALPARLARVRAEPLQPADPGHGPVHRRLRLGQARRHATRSRAPSTSTSCSSIPRASPSRPRCCCSSGSTRRSSRRAKAA